MCLQLCLILGCDREQSLASRKAQDKNIGCPLKDKSGTFPLHEVTKSKLILLTAQQANKWREELLW